jgi:tRNA 2-thiouridine synthesizing protein A
MLRVLEHLDRLAPGQRLLVIHERRPLFLYPQLEARGFSHETKERGPGEFRITIWREEPR